MNTIKEIKYLTKNKKGFSIDDIKKEDFLKNREIAIFSSKKKELHYFLLTKENNKYLIKISVRNKNEGFPLVSTYFHFTGIAGITLKEAKEKLKKLALKVGLKEHTINNEDIFKREQLVLDI